MKLLFIIMLLPLIAFSEKEGSQQNWEIKMAGAGLLDVQAIEKGILLDFRYATSNNFLKENVYGQFKKCYLQKIAAEKLVAAEKYLQEIKPGFHLLAFDCARPRSVQYKMWDLVKGTDKQGYVANPSRGSVHNFGFAVDLSIADASGQELDMGTPFDFFGDLAQPVLEKQYLKEGKLTPVQVANRELLRKVMHHAGFLGIPNEWWHFEGLERKKVMKDFKIIE